MTLLPYSIGRQSARTANALMLSGKQAALIANGGKYTNRVPLAILLNKQPHECCGSTILQARFTGAPLWAVAGFDFYEESLQYSWQRQEEG